MLVAAAFCPAAPVLVPELASGAAFETAALLRSCEAAVELLLAATRRGGEPAEICVLGCGQRFAWHPAQASGTLAGFGVDVRAGGSGEVTLPPALTLGAWLLDRVDAADVKVPRRYLEVPPDASALEAARWGEELAASPEPMALLVVGDGTSTRTPKAPGAFDARSQEYDAAIAAALGRADLDTLAALDAATATTLGDSGRVPWQVASAAARTDASSQLIDANLLAYEAPYGVGYFVATWLTR